MKKTSREELKDEIKWYCDQLGMDFSKECPEGMNDNEMMEWIACWSEYDPFPELN